MVNNFWNFGCEVLLTKKLSSSIKFKYLLHLKIQEITKLTALSQAFDKRPSTLNLLNRWKTKNFTPCTVLLSWINLTPSWTLCTPSWTLELTEIALIPSSTIWAAFFIWALSLNIHKLCTITRKITDSN